MTEQNPDPTYVSQCMALADRTLAAARMLAAEYPESAVGRAYYAAFYAAEAALWTKGVHCRTHGGLATALHQHFVQPGLLAPDPLRSLQDLLQLRLAGDYPRFRRDVTVEEALEAIELAEQFVAEIRTLIGKEDRTVNRGE